MPKDQKQGFRKSRTSRANGLLKDEAAADCGEYRQAA
jgi:hypothetical protein